MYLWRVCAARKTVSPSGIAVNVTWNNQTLVLVVSNNAARRQDMRSTVIAVTHRDAAGSYHASDITTIRSVPNASASATGESRSTGVIKAIGSDWITINGQTGGGASFEQTFKIDPHTMVWVKGASKAVSAK